MKALKRAFRSQAFKTRRLIGLEKSLVLMGEVRAAQIGQEASIECLADAEFSVFSQWGEDGILAWLTSKISPLNRTFVEFGVEDYRESNTRFLLMSKNWSGMVIDGSADNIKSIQSDDVAYKYDLQTVCKFITRDNIASLISGCGFGPRVGILSVDLDGNDYWVLENCGVEADVVVVEYNDFFGSRPVSVPYSADFQRLVASPSGMYWGASLAAFRHLLEGRRYVFIGTNRVGTNAFFVHADHASLLGSALSEARQFTCRMREARLPSGELSFRTYREMRSVIEHLPLIDVRSGETLAVKDCHGCE